MSAGARADEQRPQEASSVLPVAAERSTGVPTLPHPEILQVALHHGAGQAGSERCEGGQVDSAWPWSRR